ncbi:MAG: tetratricopeptide repeat protein [Actinomycetota bacterium]
MVDLQGHVLEQPEPTVIDVTDANFEQAVIEESKKRPVVVDLWADWCQPCKTLGPILERVAGERAGAFLLAKLDVDANPAIAGALGVQSIPTVVAFKDGAPVDGFVGSYPEPEVNRFVDGLVPSEVELQAEQATVEAQTGDVVAAEDDLRAVLTQDPDNRAARIGLGRILADRGQVDEASDLVAPLAPDPEAEQILAKIRVAGWGELPLTDEFDIARAAAARGAFREALDGLLALAATDQQARNAMLDVFAVLGDDDELVGEYRRKLSSIVF